MRTVLLSLAVLALGGCRVHTLEDGPYTFTLGEVLRDDCGVAPGGGLVTGGTLRTEGHNVALSLSEPEVRLVGTYLYGIEELTLDGSLSNFPKLLSGRQCLLDVVSYHLDAVTTSARSFDGSMSIDYQARQADECSCKLYFKLTAAR